MIYINNRFIILCSNLRDFNLNRKESYMANTITLNNKDNNIKKVYLDYSANIVANNTNNESITIEIYKETIGMNNLELLETPYNYSIVGNLKEAFTIFICDNNICNECYNYIVIYKISSDVNSGNLNIINSNIRLTCELF